MIHHIPQFSGDIVINKVMNSLSNPHIFGIARMITRKEVGFDTQEAFGFDCYDLSYGQKKVG